MNRLPSSLLFHWLTFAALADWVIARTLTRSAIFMPKSPPVIIVYQALTLAGQLAVTLTSLLALIAVFWIVWQSWRTQRRIELPLVLLGQIVVSFISLFVAPGGWLAAGYQLLAMAAISLIGVQMWNEAGVVKNKIAWSIPALALLIGELYQLLPALYSALRWPGPPPLATILFNGGELLVVLSPIGLWWVYGRGASKWAWTVAALPALGFSVMHLVNPALTGIMTIWSTGLTLYLPWPAYALSLWLAGVTVIASLRRGDSVGWATLLLAAGGHAPQLSTQASLGLIALWLLGSPEAQAVVASQKAPPSLTTFGSLETNEFTG